MEGKWVERLLETIRRSDDLRELVFQFVHDPELTDAEFNKVILDLSKNVYANQLASVLNLAVGYRPPIQESIWTELILNSRDDEAGVCLVSVMLPFVDLTRFSIELLTQAQKLKPDGQFRVAMFIWTVVSGVSRTVQTGDEFGFRECVRPLELRQAILDAIPHMQDKHSRGTLERVLQNLA